jgi:YYY domain-containing protein
MALGSVLAWLALSLALLGLGTPIAATLFPRLADRGASVALPIVLTVVFYLGYYVGRVSLDLALLGALGVVATGAVLARRRGVDLRPRRAAEVAVVFTVAYGFLVVVRATDPAIIAAGGEKFLDFGLLKALLRTETVPPADFWFAGESVLYYYGGHLVVAQHVRLLGTAPGVAYNLALSAVFASYVAAAYGLAGNVAARDGRFERRAALLGAFLVGWASNLFTPLRLLLRPLPDGVAESIARTLDVWVGRFDRAGALVTDAEPFSMWEATGVIDGAIHETPLFAFVNGDLHAHMMAPPFTLLLATALFAYATTPAAERRRRRLLLFGVVPVVGGALAVINTWSFFATGGLTALTVLFDRETPSTLLPSSHREWARTSRRLPAVAAQLVLALVAGLVAGVLAVLCSLPFWVAKVGGRSVGILPDRSSLAALLVVHGTFLVPVGLYLGYLGRARFDLSRRQLAGAGLAVVAVVALSTVPGVAAVGLVGPFLLVGYLLGAPALRGLRRGLSVADERLESLPGFELVLLLGGLGLILLVEFVFLQERAGAGRFNTVFKIYAQVWALLAVGTAVALGRLLQLAPDVSPTPRWPTVLRGFVAVLVVVTSCYGALAVGFQVGPAVDGDARLELDGTAWIERYHPAEAPAIDWLDRRDGTPTILTRPGRAYDWPGAVAAFTGLPTVVGWQHHERGFGRNPAAVAARVDDVEAMYTGSPETQRALLAKYNVSYVYVGPSERDAYGGALTIGGLQELAIAREFEGVRIYRVPPSIREN